MSPKMFIPCTIVLTEKEYTIVQQLLKELEMDDKDISLVVRKIIREWAKAQHPSRRQAREETP